MHIFTHDGNAVSNYMYCCRTYKFLCVACLVMVMHFLRKIAGTLKTLNILAFFLSVNFASATCRWVAFQWWMKSSHMQPRLKKKVNEVFTVMMIPCFSFGLQQLEDRLNDFNDVDIVIKQI